MSPLVPWLERLAVAVRQQSALAGPLRELARTSRGGRWRAMCAAMAGTLDAGGRLRDAVERHSDCLPLRVREVLMAADDDGALPGALDGLLVETHATTRTSAALKRRLALPLLTLAVGPLMFGVAAGLALPALREWAELWQASSDGVLGAVLTAASWLGWVFVALGAIPAVGIAWLARSWQRGGAPSRIAGVFGRIRRAHMALTTLVDARLALRDGRIDAKAVEAMLTPLARCVFAGVLPVHGIDVAITEAMVTTSDELDVAVERDGLLAAVALTVVAGGMVLGAAALVLQLPLAAMDAPGLGMLP